MKKVLLKQIHGNLFSDSQNHWIQMEDKMIGIILSHVVRPVDEFSMALPSDKPLKPRTEAAQDLSPDQKMKPVAIVDDQNAALAALEGGS